MRGEKLVRERTWRCEVAKYNDATSSLSKISRKLKKAICPVTFFSIYHIKS